MEESLDSYLFYRHRRPLFEALEPELGRALRVPALDGYSLAATLFGSGLPTLPTVVIASATGVRQAYYAPFASWLAQSFGANVVTFDYRGIGGSRPEDIAKLDASLEDWAELDFAGILDWADKTLEQPRHLSLVGHSIGGQLIGLLPDPSRLAAVTLVGSQSGDFRLWPTLADRALYGALWYAVIPSVVSTFGYLPGSLGIGEDLPGGVASEWARWCRTPGYMVGGRDGARRRDGYRRLRSPILAFGFDDDAYAPLAAVDALLALYENAPTRRRQVSRAEAKVGHFGFFRERFKDNLWREAASFLLGTDDLC